MERGLRGRIKDVINGGSLKASDIAIDLASDGQGSVHYGKVFGELMLMAEDEEVIPEKSEEDGRIRWRVPGWRPPFE